jgi:hypothetical protein
LPITALRKPLYVGVTAYYTTIQVFPKTRQLDMGGEGGERKGEGGEGGRREGRTMLPLLELQQVM